MKRFNLLMLVVLTAFFQKINAQNGFQLDDSYYKLSSLFAKNIQVDSAGNAKVVLLKQFSAEKLDIDVLIKQKSSSDLYNSFCEYNFDNQQNAVDKICVPYTMAGGNVSSKIGKLSVDKPVSTDSLGYVISKYPQYFEKGQQPVSLVDPVSEGFTTSEFAFDRSLGEYCRVPDPKTYSPGEEKEKFVSLDADKIGISNPQTATYTQIIEIPNPNKKSDMIYRKKNYRFATYTSKNELVDSFSIHLTYPREVEYMMPVYNKTDNTKVDGVVFFLRRAKGYGKKVSDPKKNNYEVIFIGNDGKMVFHTIARIGRNIMNTIKLWYVFSENNVLTFFGDYLSFKESGPYNFNVTADSVTSYMFMPNADASKTPAYLENSGGKPFVNKTSASSGRYWASSTDEGFTCYGHQVLSNGDILVWGRVFEEVAKTTNTGTGGGSTDFVYINKDFVCLHFNKNLEIIDQYACKMPDSKKENKDNIISYYDSNNLNFLILQDNNKMPFFLSNMISLQVNYKLPFFAKSAYSVKYININLGGNPYEIKSITTPDNFAIIYPGKFFTFSNNSLYLAGYQLQDKSPVLILKKFQL